MSSTQDRNQTVKEISLIFELERSINFLKIGLSEIQKISVSNDFYDPVFLNLANGLERLLKVILCLDYKYRNGSYPSNNTLWNNKNGHDILILIDKVVKICIPTDRPAIKQDYIILTRDEFISEVCMILSEYGKKARYFNLSVVLGITDGFDSKAEWEKLETKIALGHFGKEKYTELLKDPKNIIQIYQKINELFIVKIELFIRALARQFVFGRFSAASQHYIPIIKDFSSLEDAQLGKTTYRK